MSRKVVIIGGGVIGASCAYALTQADWQVTIIERGEFGKGCSHGNCGLVVPSHVLPLAEPGAAWMGFKSLFQREAPVSVKFRFDFSLWRWLFNFARRCNKTDMLDAGKAIKALLDSSRRLYAEWIAKEGLECEWQTRGLLFVLATAKEMDKFAESDRLLAENYGLSAKRFDGPTIERMEPALKSGLAGGWLYENDAHLRPDRLMASWKRTLRKAGVGIRENCEMTGFQMANGRARAVGTSAGEMEADAFVVAAGALTPLLAKHLGCRVPIQPGKGYSITMPRPAKCPAYPLIFPETHVAVTPMHSGYRLGSTMEFAGYDSTLNRRRLDLLRDGARPYLQEPYCEPVEEEWFGWRPMTYDGKPIIGPSPIMDNVMIAAGHNMLGLSMGPATGKLVAELLSGAPPHVDPYPYSVKRF